jgi:putative glutamine amidotransferase
MSATMLKIGISACFFHEDSQRPIFKGMTLQYIEQNVAHWLMQRDVLAFMVPSPEGRTKRRGSKATVEAYADALDGLVLMGGSDVCPESYGEKALRPEWNGDRIRDDYEIALLRAVMAARKPVLGVCRGAQIINVAQGGTLWQDLAAQFPGALAHRNWAIYEQNCHATAILPGTGLAGLYPDVTLMKTNSIHHQALKDLGRDLVVEARSEPDGVIEAIRRKGPGYVFAVQWHPEFHAPGDRSFLDDTPILDEFLVAAGEHKSAQYAV